MKLHKIFCTIIGGLLLSSLTAMAEDSPIKAIYTVPHEMDILLKAGHIQGACCSEQGIYLSHTLGIEKIGWDGKLIKHVDAPNHLGDISYGNGKIYGAIALQKKEKDAMPGLLCVWNEDLEKLAEKPYPNFIDGCVVKGDRIYFGIDIYNYPPHPGCKIGMMDFDLNDKGVVDLDIGYSIHYGVQTFATDGDRIFLGNYGAPKDKGNPEGFNCTALSGDLKLLWNTKLYCSEGFGLVPKSISKRDNPVFFTVFALGGNMQGWRKDPVNNPPRIRIDFYELRGDKFVDITKR